MFSNRSKYYVLLYHIHTSAIILLARNVSPTTLFSSDVINQNELHSSTNILFFFFYSFFCIIYCYFGLIGFVRRQKEQTFIAIIYYHFVNLLQNRDNKEKKTRQKVKICVCWYISSF